MNVQVHHGYKMKSTEDLFSDYVNNFSAIKIEAERSGDNAKRAVAKLMLNSLYGR